MRGDDGASNGCEAGGTRSRVWTAAIREANVVSKPTKQFALSDRSTALIMAVERIAQVFPDNFRTSGGNDSADILRASILRRAIKTVRAALELCRLGYDEQAVMLARTVFEDMINLHWISVDPDKAVVQFNETALLAQYRWSNHAKEYGFDPPPSRELNEQEMERAIELDKHVQNQSWTRISLPNRMKAVVGAKMFGDPGGSEAKKLSFMHEVALDLANGQTHSSPESIYGAIRRDERVPVQTVEFESERSERLTGTATLLLGYSLAHLIAQAALDSNLPLADEVTAAYHAFEDLVNESLDPEG